MGVLSAGLELRTVWIIWVFSNLAFWINRWIVYNVEYELFLEAREQMRAEAINQGGENENDVSVEDDVDFIFDWFDLEAIGRVAWGCTFLFVFFVYSCVAKS